MNAVCAPATTTQAPQAAVKFVSKTVVNLVGKGACAAPVRREVSGLNSATEDTLKEACKAQCASSASKSGSLGSGDKCEGFAVHLKAGGGGECILYNAPAAGKLAAEAKDGWSCYNL